MLVSRLERLADRSSDMGTCLLWYCMKACPCGITGEGEVFMRLQASGPVHPKMVKSGHCPKEQSLIIIV